MFSLTTECVPLLQNVFSEWRTWCCSARSRILAAQDSSRSWRMDILKSQHLVTLYRKYTRALTFQTCWCCCVSFLIASISCASYHRKCSLCSKYTRALTCCCCCVSFLIASISALYRERQAGRQAGRRAGGQAGRQGWSERERENHE